MRIEHEARSMDAHENAQHNIVDPENLRDKFFKNKSTLCTNHRTQIRISSVKTLQHVCGLFEKVKMLK